MKSHKVQPVNTVKEPAKLEESVRNIDVEFVENTTCHGLKNIVGSSYVVLKIIWTVLFLLAFGFLIAQITIMSVEYAKFAAISEVTIEVCIFLCIICKCNPRGCILSSIM